MAHTREDRLEKRVMCDVSTDGGWTRKCVGFIDSGAKDRKQELEVEEVRIVWTCPKAVNMEIYNNID